MTRSKDASLLTLDTGGPSLRQAQLVPAGPLEGEVRDGHAYFWVRTGADRAGKERTVSLVWPDGFAAREHPLRVENADGQLVAQVGDHFDSFGGNISESPGCHEGSSDRWILGPMPPRDAAHPTAPAS